MAISKAAYDLILREEIGSKALYEQRYRRPEWPGERSGPTIGIGYDLGQTDQRTIREDWQGRVPDKMLQAMLRCSGCNGAAGRAMTFEVKHLIDIPWDLAKAVFDECVLPRWEARLDAALPNAKKLSPDSRGALLSLIFNRGTSFNMGGEPGDRYHEMRNIKALMRRGEYSKIPGEMRSMKRLWPNSEGLRKRRDTEAKLFAKGISNPSAEIIGTVASSAGAGATAKASGFDSSDAIVIAILVGVAVAIAFVIRRYKRKKDVRQPALVSVAPAVPAAPVVPPDPPPPRD
jgi:hypothetical protein